MSTSKQYIQFVCDCLKNINGVNCRKMFGEYIVYIRERPILLVCDNCVMVKKVPELSELMRDAQEAFPMRVPRHTMFWTSKTRYWCRIPFGSFLT